MSNIINSMLFFHALCTGEGHSVLVDFSAHKEKILKEELTLWDPQNDKQRLTLVFNARVLGMLFKCNKTLIKNCM